MKFFRSLKVQSLADHAAERNRPRDRGDFPYLDKPALSLFLGTAAGPLRPLALVRQAALFAVTVAVVIAAAMAQDQPVSGVSGLGLEDLMKVKVQMVYGASKRLQKVTTAPASVTLVTSEEIRWYGYRTLGAILQSVPGFYISYDRNYTTAAVRGLGRTGDYNSRILLLIDGHRINDDIYNQAPLGTEFPLDVDLIDRVEIINGPSSSIYGSNAFLSVVNVITKKAGLSKGMEVALQGASLGTGSVRATYGRQFKGGWQALLSGTAYSSDGQKGLYFNEFDSPQTNNGIAQNADGDRVRQLFANLSYKEFSLQALYGTREKQIPTASFGTEFSDPRERTTDSHGYLDLSYEHRFHNQLSLTSRVYLDSYIYQGDYPTNYYPDTGTQTTLNHDYSNGAWWGEEVKLSKMLFAHHQLTVGNEFRDNFRVKQSNYDIAPFVSYLEDNHPSSVWAFYLQDEYAIRRNVLLNIGVRHDRDSTFGGTTNPRFGLIYNPLEATTLKFLYGTAFRAANAYEMFYQAAASALPNPNLKPETIHTAEVVVEQYVGGGYRVSGSVFQNKIDHLIDQVETPSGFLQFQNVGSARTTGVQLVFDRQWVSGLSFQLNYTYEHPVDLLTGDLLHNVPAHLANANLRLPFFSKRGSAGVDLHYVSSRQSLGGNQAAGFVLANLTLSTERFLGGFVLSGTIYNLFDKRYGYLGGDEHREDILYQDGRTARVKLTYSFGGGR